MPHVVGRANGPGGRSLWSGRDRPGSKPRESRPSVAIAVVLIEAAEQPGGQIRLAARPRRRSELIGIVDWRMAQCRGSASRCASTSSPRPRTCWPRGRRS